MTNFIPSRKGWLQDKGKKEEKIFMLRVSEGRPSGLKERKPGFVLLVNYNLYKAEISRWQAGHLSKARIWLAPSTKSTHKWQPKSIMIFLLFGLL